MTCIGIVYLTKFKNYSCDNDEIIIYHQTIKRLFIIYTYSNN